MGEIMVSYSEMTLNAGDYTKKLAQKYQLVKQDENNAVANKNSLQAELSNALAWAEWNSKGNNGKFFDKDNTSVSKFKAAFSAAQTIADEASSYRKFVGDNYTSSLFSDLRCPT